MSPLVLTASFQSRAQVNGHTTPRCSLVPTPISSHPLKLLGQPGPGAGCNRTAISAVEASAQESRRLIEQKISYFEERIRQLKTQRNELAPVFRLPPEILSTIFSFVVQSGFLELLAAPTVVQRYAFTHVSRTWRSVALNSPTLWRVLPSSIPWAEAMLERSKAVSLIVRLSLSYSISASTRVQFWKDAFRKHAPRIRELELVTGISKSVSLELFGDLQPSTLSLHSLRLHRSTHEDPSTFPTAIMDTKDLQSLSVTGYDGAWYSLSLPSLTELKMQNTPKRPRLEEFIETLRGSPNLQTLDIVDSLPLTSEPIRSIATVDLPMLRSLRLSSRNAKEISNVLSCIIVPSTATFKLHCTNRDSVQDDQVTLVGLASSLSVFFAAISKRGPISYDSVHILSSDSSVNLSAWKSYNPGRLRRFAPDLDLTIEPRTYQCVQTMLPTVFPSLPLHNITYLTLEMNSLQVPLKDTLRNLSCLRDVTLVGNCAFDFIAALINKPQHYNTQASAFYSVSFPALRSLCITETSCGPEGMCPIEFLQDCLMERYERKAELTKLELVECYDVYSSDVDLLREIVVDVEWDGFEMEDPGSEDDGIDEEDYLDYDDDGYLYESDYDPFYFL